METRKTTLDERVEIVKDCIEHDFNSKNVHSESGCEIMKLLEMMV
ncbi:full=transposase [Clostridioides difficile]|nr:full=transposase [Clostridioides difficile]